MSASLHWGDLANYSTALSPILAAIAVVGRVLWKKLNHELKPNSGTSLRDAIDRIETMVTETQHELENHISYHKGQESAK
jgi:hypothetical protein